MKNFIFCALKNTHLDFCCENFAKIRAARGKLSDVALQKICFGFI